MKRVTDARLSRLETVLRPGPCPQCGWRPGTEARPGPTWKEWLWHVSDDDLDTMRQIFERAERHAQAGLPPFGMGEQTEMRQAANQYLDESEGAQP